MYYLNSLALKAYDLRLGSSISKPNDFSVTNATVSQWDVCFVY